MASVSASHLIIFIASIVIAAGVAGTLTSEVGRLSGAIDDIGIDLSEDIRTDIEIISDEGSESGGTNTAYDSGAGNVTLHVKNTGSRTLPSDSEAVDVFIDGTYVSDVTVTVVDANEWREGNVAELEIDTGSLSGGDHRLKVVVGSDEEVFEFRV